MTAATVGSMPLDATTAKSLRRNATMLDRWRQSRDNTIREAHAAGASYREIAEHVGLSHVGVMKIIAKGLEVDHIRPAEDDEDGNLSLLTADENAKTVPGPDQVRDADGTIRNVLGGQP